MSRKDIRHAPSNELFIVPKKTRIYIGPEDEWSCCVQGHSISLRNACFIGANSEIARFETKVCDNCGCVFVHPFKRLSLDISTYGKNYVFDVKEGISLVNKGNESKVAEDIEWEKHLTSNSNDSSKKEKTEALIASAPNIIRDQMFDLEFCRNNLAAVMIPEGENISFGDHLACKKHKHMLQKHVLILTDNDGNRVRAGVGYICKACMRTYLELVSDNGHTKNDFAKYSFREWSSINDEPKRKKIMEETKEKVEWFRTLRDSQLCDEHEIARIHNKFITPALKIETGAIIQIGNPETHECGSPMYPCVIVLENDKGKLSRVGTGYWCPSCRHTYIEKSDYTLVKIKRCSRLYVFGNYDENGSRPIKIVKRQLVSETFSDSIRKKYPKNVPTVNNDRVLVSHETPIYIGVDKIHHVRNHHHKLIRFRMGLKRKGKESPEFFEDSLYCQTCNRFYLSFDVNETYLSTNFKGYRILKADMYEKQMKDFEEREKAKREEEARKKAEAEERQKELERLKKEQEEKEKAERRKSNMYDGSTPEGATRINGEDFLVRKGSFACLRNSHKLDEITACITVILPKGRVQDVLVSGWYCRNCGCYYISESDYQTVNKMGTIAARIYTEKEWFTNGRSQIGFNGFNSESILHKLGYNVGATDDLSSSTRHDILATAMDFSILSKREVVDFLDMMIRLRKNNPSMENAVEKWENDRNFASSYTLNTRQYVRVASLSIKERILR